MINPALEQLAFFLLAAMILGSAVMVVTLRNLVHCAFFLVLAFLGVAGIYVLLSGFVLFGVQVLIYVGAIMVLMLFAIMLTRNIAGGQIVQTNKQSPLGVVAAAGVFLLIAVLANSAQFPTAAQEPGDTLMVFARELLTTYVLPFEVASLVLLVAMVGAIIIAREKSPGRAELASAETSSKESVEQ